MSRCPVCDFDGNNPVHFEADYDHADSLDLWFCSESHLFLWLLRYLVKERMQK